MKIYRDQYEKAIEFIAAHNRYCDSIDQARTWLDGLLQEASEVTHSEPEVAWIGSGGFWVQVSDHSVAEILVDPSVSLDRELIDWQAHLPDLPEN